MSRMVTAAVVALTVTAALWLASSQFGNGVGPATGGDLVNHAERRGGYGGWIEFDYPAGWYVVDNWHTDIQSTDPSMEYTQSGDRVSIHDGVAWSDVFAEDYPPGTITDTVVVGGLPATRITFPRSDGIAWGVLTLDVPVSMTDTAPFVPYYIKWGVAGYSHEAEYETRRTVIDSIVDGIEFVSDTVQVAGWVSTRIRSPQLPGIEKYSPRHPSGWAVTETATGFRLDSPLTPQPPYTSGPVSFVFEPDVPASEWEVAEVMLGDDILRRVAGSEHVSGGRRTTTFIVKHERPVRVIVDVPVLPEGSRDFWLYEQTVWRVLYESGVAYRPQAYP